ncbi:hypothetical protein [Pseudogulbenkiania sp. MAI-1]|uniref:hypothetical protein n=1 Tax=Pseudogulbenkiania sp. MAI-1 TaxID=990370 RepID=UPI0004A41FE1|nr:hypothetical protein [Pseudogulbenkiania sp. MAI-1]
MRYMKAELRPPAAIFIVMFTVMSLFPRFEDPDLYWHLKTGELIFSMGSLPWHDVFTYTNHGNQWVLSEWLSQWIFYMLYRMGGLNGVGAFTALVYVFCWVVTYKSCRDVLGDEGKAVVVTLLFCSFMGWVAPRPHIFTFLFFSILLRQLFLFKYFRIDRGMLFIPLIMLLWANLHGGFFIGLVLMAVFISAEWGKHLYADATDCIEIHRLKKLSFFALIGLLATAVNPQGFHYWLYPYQAIVSSGDTQFINEWQSPNFHKLFFQYFLVMVFAFFACMVYSSRKPDLTEIGVSLVFISGAFVSVRNLPLAALVMAPFFAAFYRYLNLSGFLAKLNRSTSPDARRGPVAVTIGWMLAAGNKQVGRAETVMNWAMLLLALFAILLLYPSRKNYTDLSMSAMLPVAAVDFIQRNHIQGRMFNTYHYGGYLIYRLYPQQRVFIYGRTDIYPKGFVDEYREIYRGGKNWKKYFDAKKIDLVLSETTAPIKQLLLAEGRFKLVFDDGRHSVLLRDVEKYKTLVEKYSQ